MEKKRKKKRGLSWLIAAQVTLFAFGDRFSPSVSLIHLLLSPSFFSWLLFFIFPIWANEFILSSSSHPKDYPSI